MSFPQQQGFDVGSAFGRIIIDTSGVEQSIQQVNRSLGQGLQSMGAQIQSLGANLTVLTAPLLGFGVAGVRAASSFEDSLKSIEVRAGLTAEELALVEQKAIDIGRRSIYGPGQAAEAFLQLLTTGMSTADAMEVIDSVIAGAAASGENLAFVADGLTDIMASFQLGVEDAEATMQTLIDATGASSADLPMMAAAMANVGTVANAFNFTVEETAAALAVLHENGIKGASAGTALKSALLNLQRPTEEVQNTLNELGVSTTDAQGNFKDLDTILRELNVAMADLTPEERQRALFTLGGSYGMVGLSALLASDGIGDMTAAMDEQADISDIANSRLDTFSGAVSFLQGSVELLMIRALRPLMDNVLAPMVTWLADVVNKLEGWITANPELANQIVQVLAVVAVLGPALVIVGTVLSAIGGIIGAILSPIGLLIAAIAGLALAWQTNFMGIREVVNDVWNNTLQPAFERFFTWLNGGEGGDVGGGLLSILEGIANLLVNVGIPAIASFVAWFLDNLPVAFETVGIIWENVLQPALMSISTFITETVLPALSSFANWFISNLPIAFNAAKTLWDNVLQPIFSSIATFIIETVLPALGQLFTWFVEDALPVIVNFVETFVIPAIQTFIDILGSIWEVVSPVLASLFNWFMETGLPLIKTFIEEVVMPAIQTFIDILVGIWEAIKPGLETLFNWFMETGLPVIKGFIEDWVIPAIQNFIDILGDIWNAIQPGIEAFKNGIQNAFNWVIDNVINPLINTIGGIAEALGSINPFGGGGGQTAIGSSASQRTASINRMRQQQEAAGATAPRMGQYRGVLMNIASGRITADQALADLRQTGALSTQAGQGYAQLLQALASGQITVEQAVQQLDAFSKVAVPPVALGTNYVTQDMLAMIHQGEAIVPASMNPYNPNAQTNGLGNGPLIEGGLHIHANTEAGGRAAARGFADELDSIMTERDFR